jgi:Short C-terminal domain
MGMVRRRTRRRTMLVAGGVAYAAGRRASQGDEPQGDEPQEEGDEQEYDAPPPAPPAPAAAAPAEDATSELERLASMHDSGVLSDEEFAAAKAKVLGT